jgi:transposase
MKKETTRQRRKYDDAYRQQALELIRHGQSVSSVAQTLGISEALLYKWKKAIRPTPVQDEMEQLRLRLKQVEMERDILKKALSIFSRT